MLDAMHDAASFRNDRTDVHIDDADALPSPGSLDELLAELISQSPEISLSNILPITEPMPVEAEQTNSLLVDPPVAGPLPTAMTDPAMVNLADTALIDTPMPAITEPMPARVYSMSDLMLFERLTSYRLVAQRQLWRSVDKDGNRATAGDRLFTVLAEEAFQLADRQRRNGLSPQADLTVRDIADVVKPLRSIAAHLGERGHQAADRLEAVLTAALNWRRSAA